MAVLVVVDVPTTALLLTITTKLIVCETLAASELTTAVTVLPEALKSRPVGLDVAPSFKAVPGALLQTAEPGTYVKPAGTVSVIANMPAEAPLLLKFRV